MFPLILPIAITLGNLSWGVEQSEFYRRRQWRSDYYERAKALALSLGKTLVVIGAPDGWGAGTGLYGCGDLCLDLDGCAQCNTPGHNIDDGIPLADDSAVVFVSCVLEYVEDLPRVWDEICRVAGPPAGEVGSAFPCPCGDPGDLSRVFVAHISSACVWTYLAYRPEARWVIVKAPPEDGDFFEYRRNGSRESMDFVGR